MNADYRANPPASGVNNFRSDGTPANSNPEGMPRTGGAPQNSTPGQGQGQPRSGQVPQRTSIRSAASGQFPTATPPRTAQQPATGAQPTGAPQSGRVFAPTSTQQPVSGSPVGDTAPGGVKGFAVRAKDSLTEGDDVKAAGTKGGPRKARVLLSRIDPWSALKVGFLLSIAAGIMLTVAIYVLWNILNQAGLFALANEWISKLFTEDQELNLLQFFDLNRIMSATVLVAVINVFLLTALTTVGAFLYNTVSSIVGGVYVTLTDD